MRALTEYERARQFCDRLQSLLSEYHDSKSMLMFLAAATIGAGSGYVAGSIDGPDLTAADGEAITKIAMSAIEAEVRKRKEVARG